MSSNNEVVLVDQFVQDLQRNRDIPIPDDVAFELFAAATVLETYHLSNDEIEGGRTGGSLDGGIDAAYTFLDDQLLDEDAPLFQEDFRLGTVRKGVNLTLWLVQAKRSRGFREDAFDKVRSSTEKLLTLSALDTDLSQLYSAGLISRLKLFTTAWKTLATRLPRISIRFAYVSRGDTRTISSGVIQKTQDLKSCLESTVPGANISVNLVGARELWKTASATPDDVLLLRFRDYVSEGDSYTGLVALPDYARFLTDGDGGLRGYLFDWNVRDYQGENVVNRQIKAALESDDNRDFWWLNNGVTILCADANISGDKTFTLTGVQIVNGMQTSRTIYDVLESSGAENGRHKQRSVQVRIIKTQDEETRDQIIRATNSQTKVPDASLHATEDLHRQLEAHFVGKGWFYDRRKNFYKNQGKPADRIIGIPMLGQAVMAIGLSRPNDARARPTSLLNKDDDYNRIFDASLSLDIYLWIAKVQRQVDNLLLSVEGANDASVRTNTRFYVSCYLVSRSFGSQIHSPSQLADLVKHGVSIDASDVQDSLAVVLAELERVAAKNSWQPERASKNRSLAEAVISRAINACGIAQSGS